jgi:hypothetical protein
MMHCCFNLHSIEQLEGQVSSESKYITTIQLVYILDRMPPSRPKPQPDDSRSEASSTKERVGTAGTLAAMNGKGRRNGNGAVTSSSLRDVTTAGQSGTVAGGSGTTASENSTGVSCRQPPNSAEEEFNH